jgi:hypothetical protein
MMAHGQSSPSGQLSFAKTLRLVRLAKMLRVARLKRIVGRHASLVEFGAYMNSVATFCFILYMAHLLSCTWYWLGSSSADGWAVRDDHVHGNLHNSTYYRRYAVSIYTVFKLGDSFAETPEEQTFAFVSEVVISLIYGALAGVMSTLMMAGSVGEQEYLVKLAQLKAWMKAKHLSTTERARLMSLFSANHQSATYYDEKQILAFLPLAVSRDLSLHLYLLRQMTCNSESSTCPWLPCMTWLLIGAGMHLSSRRAHSSRNYRRRYCCGFARSWSRVAT